MTFTAAGRSPQTNYTPGMSEGAVESGEMFASGPCGEMKMGGATRAGGRGECGLGDAAAGAQDPPEGVQVGVQGPPA